MNAPTVRAARPEDREQWSALFRGYREFYRLEPDDDVVTRVWSWITDPSHETNGLVAEADGRLLGIAHYRRFARPSTGSTGLWLDDLFTAPEARGRGVARLMINRLQALAAESDCSVVRWITADDNHQAQALYDTLAAKTSWVTYDAPPKTQTGQEGS